MSSILDVQPGDYEPIIRGYAENRLVLPRCDACGSWVFPPADTCRSCRARRVTWQEVHEPSGTLFTYTVIWHTTSPGFSDQVPYTVAIVEVDNTGVRLAGRVLDAAGSELDIGQPMRPHFESAAGAVATLCWKPGTGRQTLQQETK